MRLELFKIKFAHFREYGLKHQQAAYKIDQMYNCHIWYIQMYLYINIKSLSAFDALKRAASLDILLNISCCALYLVMKCIHGWCNMAAWMWNFCSTQCLL